MVGGPGSAVMNLAVTISLKNQMGAWAASAASQLNQVGNAAKKAGRDLDELKSKYKSMMTQGALQMAGGVAALAPIGAAAYAFAEQEEAGARLKMTMMDAGGAVRKEFDGIQTKATELGNRLKGSTSDFLRLADTMSRLGVSGDTLLGGGLEAAAYLGTVIGVPYEQAGEAVAKLREAMGVADADLLAFMDDIQRLSFQGVDLREMQYAFTKISGVTKSLGMSGLSAARDIEPLIGMLIKAGFHGEEAGTTLSALMTQALDPERLGKANAALAGTGIALEFADKKTGEFLGVQNMVSQLEKLRGLSDTARMGVLKELTGRGGDSRVASLLIEKGVKGYQQMSQAMKDQADIKAKTGVMDDTLAQKWENLKGTVENLAAAIGASLKGALGSLLSVLNSVVGALSDFAKSHPGLFRVAATVLAVGAAVVMATGAVRMMVGAFGFAKVAIMGALKPLTAFFATNAYSTTMAQMGVTRMSWTWTILKAKIMQAGVAVKGFLKSASVGWGALAMVVGAILTDSQGIATATASLGSGLQLGITAAAGLLAAINPILGLSIMILANWDKILRAWAIVTGNDAMLAQFGQKDFATKHYDSQRDQNERAVIRKNYDRTHGEGAYDRDFGETIKTYNEGMKAAGSSRTGAAEKYYQEQAKKGAEAATAAAAPSIRDGIGNAVGGGVADGIKKGTQKKAKVTLDVAGLDKLQQFERYAEGAVKPGGMPADIAKLAMSMKGAPAKATGEGARTGGGAATAAGGRVARVKRNEVNENIEAKNSRVAELQRSGAAANMAMQAAKKAGIYDPSSSMSSEAVAEIHAKIEQGMSPDAAAQQVKAAALARMPVIERMGAAAKMKVQEQNYEKANAGVAVSSSRVAAAPASPPKATSDRTLAAKKEKPSRTVTIQNLTINAANGQEGKAVARTVTRELNLAVQMG